MAILNNFIFFLAVIFCFTIPGIVLCQSILRKISFPVYLAISTVVGFTLFSLLSYFLLSFGLTFLLFPIVILLNIASIKLLPDLQKIKNFKLNKKLFILLMVIIIGVAGQLLIIAPSGRLISGDLVFWSSHGHDGSWHLALMEEIKKGFPLQNPVFAGEKLVNYHFFSDIAPALFNQYFKIPTLDLYFRFFPFLFSLLLGVFSFYLGKELTGNFYGGVWAVFFTYFSGSFGYIATLLKNGSIGGESFFWASQIQSSSGNPPLIASLVILLTLLSLLKILYEKPKPLLPIFTLSLLLLGSLVEFKSYGALVALISIGTVGIWQVIKERSILIFSLFILGSLISFVLYLPNSSGVGGFLIWQPWWFIRTMVVAPDRLNWIDLELRRQTYIVEANWKRVFQVEITAFLIFLFGNLGLKFIGFAEFAKIIKHALSNYFNLTLVLICLTSFILPLLFLQKGVAGNTIQFLQYFLLILGILAGVSVSRLVNLIHSKLARIVLIATIVALAIPTQGGLIKDFYSRPPLAKIDREELQSLKYIRQNIPINSVILTAPFNKNLNIQSPTLPIWAWSDTSYVSAFSSRRTYLADTEQVDIMGYKLDDRLKIQKAIFSENNPEIFEKFLKTSLIDYLYFPKILKPAVDLSKTNLKKIFSNSSVEIWGVYR